MRCAIYGCNVNNKKKDSKKKNSFYSFPKDENMRRKWIALCQRSDVFSANNARICGKHFVESDFLPVNPILGKYGFYSVKRLRANVEPTMFLSIKKEKDSSNPCATRGRRQPSRNITRRFKKQPNEENNLEATTSTKFNEQEYLLKNEKEETICTKASDQEYSLKHITSTESPPPSDTDDSYTVLEIIEENEDEIEEDKEPHYKDENYIPTPKRRKLNVHESPLEDALQCMKTYMSKNKKRDEHSVFGELIAHKIRTCNRSNREIAIAHHHIENVIFNLTMGVYNKVRPAGPLIQNESTKPSNINIEPSTMDLQYNLIIPKSEPE